MTITALLSALAPLCIAGVQPEADVPAVVAPVGEPVFRFEPAPAEPGELSRIFDGLHLSDGQLVRGEHEVEPSTLPDRFRARYSIDGGERTLRMWKHSPRGPMYQVWVQDASGVLTPATPGPVCTYRGQVEGLDGSVVSGSIIAGAVRLTVWLPDGGAEHLQPATDGVAEGLPPELAAQSVVFRSRDVLHDGSHHCGVSDGPAIQPAPLEDPQQRESWFARAEIALDADREFYALNGSSVANTEADVTAVINNVNVVYERDVNLTHVITRIIVRTSEPDPYSATDPDLLYDQFRTQWIDHHSDVTRDMAHLFTGKELDGVVIGLASLGAVCTNQGYGLSQSRFSNNTVERTTLTAHELGHNWGASHCNQLNPPVTPCRIMCSVLGDCDGLGAPAFEPYAQQVIRDFAFLSRDCLDLNNNAIWVDFGYSGFGNGTYLFPFNTIGLALTAAGSTGRSVAFKPGVSPFRGRIDNHVFLEATVGNVLVGR